MIATETVATSGRNLQQPTNHEDSSNLDNFWIESIAPTGTIISEVSRILVAKQTYQINPKRYFRSENVARKKSASKNEMSGTL